MILRATLRAIVALAILSIAPGCGTGVREDAPMVLRSSSIIAGSTIFAGALVLDGHGAPHIAFISGAEQRELRYRAGTGLVETVADIGAPGQMEFSLSLALNEAGVPGIAYEQGHTLVYSVRDSTGWRSETVDGAPGVGYFATLAYDQAGRPHISYFDQRHNNIKYATRAADHWRIETIDATGQPGFHIPAGFTRIAVDCWPSRAECTEARPHVVYLTYRYKPYDGELRYAERAGHGWRISTIDGDKGAGGFPSLALDMSGRPWVSYYRASTWDFAWGELRLAHLDDRGWHIETLDQGAYVGRYNALALDPAGRPIVAYYSDGAGGLRLMWRDEGWRRASIDGGDGSWVTLAVDPGSTAHLTFVDRTEQRTRYATLRLPGHAWREDA